MKQLKRILINNISGKKIVSFFVFGFFILFIVLKNNSKKQSLVNHTKYTVVKILSADVFGKNQTKFTFILEGKEVTSYGKLLWNNEREDIIGENVFLEYDSTNIENSNIILDVQIPEGIQVPKYGWKQKPDWAGTQKATHY